MVVFNVNVFQELIYTISFVETKCSAWATCCFVDHLSQIVDWWVERVFKRIDVIVVDIPVLRRLISVNNCKINRSCVFLTCADEQNWDAGDDTLKKRDHQNTQEHCKNADVESVPLFRNLVP